MPDASVDDRRTHKRKEPPLDHGFIPWRVGTGRNNRTIWDADRVMVGVMDHPSLAVLVVESVNRFGAEYREELVRDGDMPRR